MGKVNESKKASEAVGRLFFTTPAMDLHHHVARPRGGRASRKARATTRWPGSAWCPPAALLVVALHMAAGARARCAFPFTSYVAQIEGRPGVLVAGGQLELRDIATSVRRERARRVADARREKIGVFSTSTSPRRRASSFVAGALCRRTGSTSRW